MDGCIEAAEEMAPHCGQRRGSHLDLLLWSVYYEPYSIGILLT